MCVCSLRYPTYNAHAQYCHLWPVRLYNFFPHYYYYYYYYYHHYLLYAGYLYIYIPETNNVPREYIVAAILLLLFMVPISPVPALAVLCSYVSTFRSMCAVPNMAVFCSSLTSLLLLLLLLLLSSSSSSSSFLLHAGYLYTYS
jgi:hypothetical protein